MRLVTFASKGGEPVVGALSADVVVDLHRASGGRLPKTMLPLLRGGEALWEQARALAKDPPATAITPLADVFFKAPLPDPGALRDFFAFEAHAKAGAERRKETLAPEWYQIPAYYKGNHREIYGPDETVPWPAYTRKLDFECEIAAVVGKGGRDLEPHQAREHIFGYMIFNDFSARDIQRKEMVLRMGPAKSKDFANAFGPWLVTADEIEPSALRMKVKVNGEVWSEGRFGDQHWGFPLMLSHVSQGESVYPGDILGSGTFHKGCGLDLDRWIKPGDVVELEVPGLGVLRNTIGEPAGEKELKYDDTATRPAA